MPSKAPVFRPPGWRPRKAWERPLHHDDRRIRGHAGMKLRAEVMAEEPFCRLCLEDGKRVRSEEVDHIVPLAMGGEETRSNKQALCKPCHAEKSKRERAEARQGGGPISGPHRP
jgi:5-methylcytosine-specific restriction protein A